MTFKQFIKGLAVSLLILVVVIAGLLAATAMILKNGAQKAIQPTNRPAITFPRR